MLVTEEMLLYIPNGCLDAYEVKVNKDTFQYQAIVKWLISQFERLTSKVWKAVLTYPYLDILNVLFEFALFSWNNCKIVFEVFASIGNVNPMQIEFGDRKMSQRTKGPEGDFCLGLRQYHVKLQTRKLDQAPILVFQTPRQALSCQLHQQMIWLYWL